MRLVLIDETSTDADPPAPLAAELFARAAAGGVAVTRVRAGAAGAADTAAAALASADVAVLATARDAAARARALGWVDAHLAQERPALVCCHAAGVTAQVAGLATAGRCVGYALLPPSAGRATVECARGLATSDAAAAAAADAWRALGLEAVWVGDGAGLALPRIVACLANEAAFAVMEGAASAADIDRAMRLGTRYPRGPLAWADAIGLPAVVATLDGLAAEHGEDRYRTAPLLRRMAAAGARWFPEEEG